MATINPLQDYDIMYRLTFSSTGGIFRPQLYQGTINPIAGTIYYREGTSGDWTPLILTASSPWTTLSISNKTMELAYNWDKVGNDYKNLRITDIDGNGKLTGVNIIQKEVLSGVIGNCFMRDSFSHNKNLTSIDFPDVSQVTSVGSHFLGAFAPVTGVVNPVINLNISQIRSVGNYFLSQLFQGCTNLNSVGVPDTSKIETVGTNFMINYVMDCPNLTSVAIPDTSGIESADINFMIRYAQGCDNLTRLEFPAVGYFKDNNIDWYVPSSRLGYLKGYVKTAKNLSDWQALTVSGKTLYTNYIRSSADVILEDKKKTSNFLSFFIK